MPATWEMFAPRLWEWVRAWKKKRDWNRVVWWVYFELHYPYYIWVCALHPLPNAENAGGPLRKSSYQSLPCYLPIGLPIYSSAHLMTIHPVHFTTPLLLLHLSDNQSINRSICASTQRFIYLSIYLPIIHPFVYRVSVRPSILAHSVACFHQFPAAPSVNAPQLFKVLHMNTTGCVC